MREQSFLWAGAIVSASLHAALFGFGNLSLSYRSKPTIEIDLTNAVHMGPASGPAVKPAKASLPPRSKPAPKPKEWTRPAPGQKAPLPKPEPRPAPEETPPSSQAPSPAGGPGGGETGLGQVSRLPQLLNLADLSAILRRYYPEEERARGDEGTVVLDLHLDQDGRVTSADVVRSGGAAFDGAALRAARLLRFTPAFVGGDKVAVKIRQAIQFKLEPSQ